MVCRTEATVIKNNDIFENWQCRTLIYKINIKKSHIVIFSTSQIEKKYGFTDKYKHAAIYTMQQLASYEFIIGLFLWNILLYPRTSLKNEVHGKI